MDQGQASVELEVLERNPLRDRRLHLYGRDIHPEAVRYRDLDTVRRVLHRVPYLNAGELTFPFLISCYTKYIVTTIWSI